jgi:hypothetical protein
MEGGWYATALAQCPMMIYYVPPSFIPLEILLS